VPGFAVAPGPAARPTGGGGVVVDGDGGVDAGAVVAGVLGITGTDPAALTDKSEGAGCGDDSADSGAIWSPDAADGSASPFSPLKIFVKIPITTPRSSDFTTLSKSISPSNVGMPQLQISPIRTRRYRFVRLNDRAFSLRSVR
jgi:hypothetical protein